jgi:hypothetical protein
MAEELDVADHIESYRGMLASGVSDEDALDWMHRAPDDVRFRYLSQVVSAFTVLRSPTNDPSQSQMAIFRSVQQLQKFKARDAISRAEYAILPDTTSTRPIDLTMACALMGCAASAAQDPILDYIWRIRSEMPVLEIGASSSDATQKFGWRRLAEMVGSCLDDFGDPGAARWLDLAAEQVPTSRTTDTTAALVPNFCSQCGTPLSPGINFCSNCGHRVAE